LSACDSIVDGSETDLEDGGTDDDSVDDEIKNSESLQGWNQW